MPAKAICTTSSLATVGPDDHSRTLDGAFDVALATPKEMGGAAGAGNNPEQLFAAGHAICVLGAMKAVWPQLGARVPADADVGSTVSFGQRSEGCYGRRVALAIAVPGPEARFGAGSRRQGA